MSCCNQEPNCPHWQKIGQLVEDTTLQPYCYDCAEKPWPIQKAYTPCEKHKPNPPKQEGWEERFDLFMAGFIPEDVNDGWLHKRLKTFVAKFLREDRIATLGKARNVCHDVCDIEDIDRLIEEERAA